MYVSKIHQRPEEVEATIKMETFVVKCAKKKFNWVDPDQSQKLLNGTGKKDGGIACFFIGMPRLSMQQCLEIWLIVLTGLYCKPDVLSSASTLTDIMKPRPNTEPGRYEQRFTVSQKNDWKSGHPPACQMGNLIPSWNKQHWRRPCHYTADTSWQDDFSWWWFQWCHSNWVCQPRHRHKPFRGISWGGRYKGVPPVNNQASSNFVVSQDTDVGVLPLVHFDKMKCPKIWIKR